MFYVVITHYHAYSFAKPVLSVVTPPTGGCLNLRLFFSFGIKPFNIYLILIELFLLSEFQLVINGILGMLLHEHF